MNPIFSPIRSSLAAILIALSVSATLAPQPIFAQPTPQQEQTRTREELKKVREQAQAMRKTDPKGAAELIKQFVQTHQLDPDDRLDVLVYAQTDLLEESGQQKEAVQMLDFLIKESTTRVADGASPTVVVRPQSVKMRVLSGQKKYDEAVQVLAPDADWQRIEGMMSAPGAMEVAVASAAVGVYLDALQSDGKHEVASTKILQLLQSAPMLITGTQSTVKSDLVPRLVRALNAQNKNELALSWAKVAYLMATFDNASIEQSNKLLAQSWGIDNFATLRAFTRAQEAALDSEEAKKNPLFAVPLPPQVLAIQDELRARATKLASARASRHDAVSLFLLSEDWHAAMETALAMWRDDPANNAGIGEINRVFKAADLSPASGNAFIAFLDDAKGDNPVKAFLEAHPPRAGATQ